MTDQTPRTVQFDIPPRQAVRIDFGIGYALADPYPFAPSIPLVAVLLQTGVVPTPDDLQQVETTQFLMTADRALEIADRLRRAAKDAITKDGPR